MQETPTRAWNSFVNEAERDCHWHEMCANTCYDPKLYLKAYPEGFTETRGQ